MERELTRRCGRHVRVAEFVGSVGSSCHSIVTGGNGATGPDEHLDTKCLKWPLFAGYVETLYAQSAWLGFRVDIWASSGTCHRLVRATSCYVCHGKDTLEVTTGDAMRELLKAKGLALRVAVPDKNETPVLTGDELTGVLEDLVKEFVQAFQKIQVQALMDATCQRAKFEYELLQHHPGLELLILRNQAADTFVLFMLPLLGEMSSWDPKRLGETDDPTEVFIPDGFNTPNGLDTLTISMGYPVDDDDNMALWPLFVEWPREMLLSSQITQTPSSSQAQSSVELVASCKQVFLQQWRKRKDFVAELRRHVIVLEYDPVDFSQVFFLLQEQLDEHSPLRIIVLRLQFTAAFSLTNCTSDLHLAMLDGEPDTAPVPVVLPVLSTISGSELAVDGQKCVTVFLEATRKGLLQHFYEE